MTPPGNPVLREISDRIERELGWAKSGISGGYYLMDRENIDGMRDGLVRYIAERWPGSADTWIVLTEDRHSDVGVLPFSSEEGAVSHALNLGLRSGGAVPAELTGAMRADGWVLWIPYGTEGDRIRVVRRTVDERSPQ